jgi:hypothetical protein
MTEEIEFILDSTKESMTLPIEKRIFKHSCGKRLRLLGSVLLIITVRHAFLQVTKPVPNARTITFTAFERNILILYRKRTAQQTLASTQ